MVGQGHPTRGSHTIERQEDDKIAANSTISAPGTSLDTSTDVPMGIRGVRGGVGDVDSYGVSCTLSPTHRGPDGITSLGARTGATDPKVTTSASVSTRRRTRSRVTPIVSTSKILQADRLRACVDCAANTGISESRPRISVASRGSP